MIQEFISTFPGNVIFYIMVFVYLICSLILFVYAANCYLMVYLFNRRRNAENKRNRNFLNKYSESFDAADLPVLTTQLPVYNEKNVVKRLIEAVAAIDYPREKHEIQVLDDSTDDTSPVISETVNKLKSEGVDIVHIQRGTREGFKAGALEHGLEISKGDFLAIFDADFVPGRDFFKKTVPFFNSHEKYAAVQARWGHLNDRYSWLTTAQAIGLDAHFAVEQSARAWNDLYMNFNGTAGIWRKEAIIDAGGWQSDTLTEDMDLSYRTQLAGWKMKFVFNVCAPAELPSNVTAFKSQQYRWAKGSTQTAIKLLGRILKSDDSLLKKFEAFLHLTHYAIHPLILILAAMAMPVLFLSSYMLPVWAWCLLAGIFFISTIAPSSLYLFAQKVIYKKWLKRILYMPWLMCVGVGIAVNNSKAVFEALLGIKSPFVRTPKLGDSPTGSKKKYFIKSFPIFWFEIIFGIYGAAAFVICLNSHRLFIGYFMLVYAVGFLYIGISSLLENRKFKISNSCPASAAI